MALEQKQVVTFGGWFQRTTLHLTEIYSFMHSGYSKLSLDKDKLKENWQNLALKSVSRELGYLEYVKAITEDDIEIRYYEDGLYILQLETNDIQAAKEKLEKYFEEKFNPAISYIFSLGAPTPKILANIKTTHPTVVRVVAPNPEDFLVTSEKFGEVYSKVSAKEVTVYKTEEYIFIVTKKDREEMLESLVEMQIFFREFKDQLEKYLNTHRKIWEEVSTIKERRFIKGREIEEVRTKLDSYQKTVNLISSRINQMSTYIQTRESLSKDLEVDKKLVDLFRYRYEVLTDTHRYIQEVWKMTSDYLSTAIDGVKEIQNQSINSGIRSLSLITSVGVLSGLLGYFSRDSLPTVTNEGLIYFALLVSIVLPVNFLIGWYYRNQKYKLNIPENMKKI